MVGQKARTLSGGQRQRLSLARAFLRDSPLLLLDEPTTGLDPQTARRVMQPLRWMSQHRTTIIVTHDPTALEIADRVITLSQGRVTADRVRRPRSAATKGERMSARPRWMSHPSVAPGEELVPGYEVVALLRRGNRLDVYDAWSTGARRGAS